ncbi:CACTA en-spm transposon protein [Cucumis melo var. makuwa]|uniref:CACTA en-spm transposon protein n=1 Tax=Cucumis melo var. makuwa TaxID=1194695 RepID=A0A5A7V613_CUCMM|nr:CACTA en-spm transposon protein [Cucumis melo var. makuwa]
MIVTNHHYVVIFKRFQWIDAMFLEFAEDLNSPTGGSSLEDENLAATTQPSLTPSPKRRGQSQLLEWTDIGREYIEVVKDDLHCFFVLDFNDQAMNRFVEHQILSTFKESNPEPTILLDRRSLTIIATGQSGFYNNSMSSLSKEVEFAEVKRAIEEQRKTQEMLASQVEHMRKLIEDMNQAQQGPSRDP